MILKIAEVDVVKSLPVCQSAHRNITEIGGHAIADEKADLPFMALNDLHAYLLK
jgi:hypothetical protein